MSYKYSGNLNYRAAIELGLELDIIDLAIFDTLKDFSFSDECKSFNDNGKKYYLFAYKLIVNQLPLLGISTRQGIYNRLTRLSDAKLIEPHPNNKANSTAYYAFAENCSKMSYFAFSDSVPVNETLHPVNETLHNNIYISNIDNKQEKKEINNTVNETLQGVNQTALVFSVKESFDKFWSILKNKKDKDAAERAYAAVFKKYKKFDQRIIEGRLINKYNDYVAYLSLRKEITGFAPAIKNPASWLNGGGYESEYELTKEAIIAQYGESNKQDLKQNQPQQTTLKGTWGQKRNIHN